MDADILELCLQALAHGDTIETCVARYPQQARWLLPALQTARLIEKTAPTDSLDLPTSTRLESRLMAQFDSAYPAKNTLKTPVLSPTFQPLQRWVAVLIVAFGLALLGGTGTVMASANSMPNDTLYSVKRAWELFIVQVASFIGRLDEVWAHLAQVRYEEWVYMQSQGLPDDALLEALTLALENAFLWADSDTAPTVMRLVEMLNASSGLTTRPQTSQVLALRALLRVQWSPDGQLQFSVPAGFSTLPAPPTVFLSPTPAIGQLVLPSATPELLVFLTHTPTHTATFAPSATYTPRFAPTATRTPIVPTLAPTATPTLTVTPIQVASATPTLTPLPMLGLTAVLLPTVTPLGHVAPASADPLVPTATPSNGRIESPFVRQTYQAVYITQTAEAQSTEAP